MRTYALVATLVSLSLPAFARQPIATVYGQGVQSSLEGHEVEVSCGYTLYRLSDVEVRALTQDRSSDIVSRAPQLDFFVVTKEGKKQLLHRHNDISDNFSIATAGSTLKRTRAAIGLGPAPETVKQLSFDRNCSSDMQGPPPNNRCITDITFTTWKAGVGAPWTGYTKMITLKCALDSIVNDYDPKHVSLTPIIRFTLHLSNVPSAPTLMDSFD